MSATATYLASSHGILRAVDIVFQVMAKAAYTHDGLFPAVTERQNGNLLMDFPLPAPIPGQRNSDRSPRGCNLAHDVGLLLTLDGLGESLGRERYHLQRDAYLQTFATVCAPVSPTGLLPWGEHSFWNLQHGTIGNSYLLQYGEQPLDAGIPTHHQLDILPESLWRIIHTANPRVLPRFVDGLDWHWDDDERTSFNRHAPITQLIRGYQVKRGARMAGKPVSEHSGSDFPGAAGVFIHDYAMALALVDEPDPRWRQDLLDFSDKWWNGRLDNGLLPKSSGKSRLNYNGPALDQTLSHASSLLAAAPALRGRDDQLAELLFERGTAFMQAILAVPQPELDAGCFHAAHEYDMSPFKRTSPWTGDRGQASTGRILLQLLNAAHAAGLEDQAIAIAQRGSMVYQREDLPVDQILRASEPAAIIGLTTELARATGDEAWQEAALRHATVVMERFFDSPLPRCAIGRNHYEPQLGSSSLVHALARLVLVMDGHPLKGGLERPLH